MRDNTSFCYDNTSLDHLPPQFEHCMHAIFNHGNNHEKTTKESKGVGKGSNNAHHGVGNRQKPVGKQRRRVNAVADVSRGVTRNGSGRAVGKQKGAEAENMGGKNER